MVSNTPTNATKENTKNEKREALLASSALHSVSLNPPRPSKSYLLQLVGAEGSGTRRLALHFVQPAKTVLWMSPRWNLYAPLLWKLAAERGIRLLGVECGDRNRWRMLWREVLDSQVFDGWVLDHLQLNSGEASFLQKMTRAHPLRILSLESKPMMYFQNRAHLHLSHHSYRLQWMKGGPLTPQYFAAPYLESFAHAPCLS